MTPLARGTYAYWRDGVLQPVTEPWALTRAGEGLRLRGERLREGKPLLRVDARYEGARCTSLHLEWLAGKPRAFDYEVHGKALIWREGDATGEVALPGGGLLFPLLRAATGPLVAQLAAEPAFVVVPSLHDPESKRFLLPDVTPRRATFLGDRYQYYGGEYADDGCECWLDSHQLLTRYVWASAQGTWDVRLQDLVEDPSFEGFR